MPLTWLPTEDDAPAELQRVVLDHEAFDRCGLNIIHRGPRVAFTSFTTTRVEVITEHGEHIRKVALGVAVPLHTSDIVQFDGQPRLEYHRPRPTA